MKLFLDTNVLIDFMSERQPYYMPAATLFTFAIEQRCTIAVSSLSMVTANYICCERGNTGWGDFEDCVQYQVAKKMTVM